MLFAGLLGAVSLSAQTAGSRSWSIRDAPEDLRPMISRADLTIAAMQDSHLRQLQRQLAEGGPDVAFGVAHMQAPQFSHRRGDAGIVAGFTSDRLRNTTNQARPWAAGFVAKYAGRRARDVEGFVVDLGDRVGVLRPMVQQHVCASCHGPASKLSPAVRRSLAERYPADRATGFAEGEIRGWFWVEMPKAGRGPLPK
jgi:hypothetical protein